MPMNTPKASRHVLGSDAGLRGALVAMVRRRVPESDVEDVVQATLAEAIESPHAPEEPEQLRRWIFGVAKNKVVDLHRRRGRETFDVPEDIGHDPAPHVEADLLRWAEKRLPPGDESQKTLEWMLREGEGEKLESIAESEKLPAPRVRQRVSRLRRHLKANWQREVALLAAVGVVITCVVLAMRRPPEDAPIAHDPQVLPAEPEALRLRKEALGACDAQRWTLCIAGLDEAQRLDPAGDSAPTVQNARRAAERALAPAPEAPEAPKLPPTKPAPLSTTAPVPTLLPMPMPSFAPSSNPSPKKPAPVSKPPSKTSMPRFDSDSLGGSGTSKP